MNSSCGVNAKSWELQRLFFFFKTKSMWKALVNMERYGGKKM